MTWWMWLLAGLGYAAGAVACRRCYWRGFRQGMRTEARFEAADCGWTDEALAELSAAANSCPACRGFVMRQPGGELYPHKRFANDTFDLEDCPGERWPPRVPVLNDGWSPPWQPAQFAPGMERVLAAQEAALIGALADRADGIIESIRRPA